MTLQMTSTVTKLAANVLARGVVRIFISGIFLFTNDDASGLNILAVDGGVEQGARGFPGELDYFDGLLPVAGSSRVNIITPANRVALVEIKVDQVAVIQQDL